MAYRELRAELLPGRCEVCEPLNAALERSGGYQVRCQGTGTELHHLRKRSSSGALAERDNVRVSCHTGNMAVEMYPAAALVSGLVIREGHPDWERLSSRTWRMNNR